MSPINPIIPYLQPQDQPPTDFHENKMLLNEESNNKSKIQGLVSYIYYPSQKKCMPAGHAKVEIEGEAWTLLCASENIPLSEMIDSSLSGYGRPFFRFNISTTPEQLRDLREKAMQTMGLTCSMGALRALSKHAKYTVPFPLSLSPLVSALYLTAAKSLDSKRINKIEFYGSESYLWNFSKSIRGIACETLFFYAIYQYFKL